MGDFWKATEELYKGFIDKPKMAEKLLMKPPFKYLFDIITSTTQKTGFANGTYLPTQDSTLEMNLRQIITMTNKEKLPISPKSLLQLQQWMGLNFKQIPKKQLQDLNHNSQTLCFKQSIDAQQTKNHQIPMFKKFQEEDLKNLK